MDTEQTDQKGGSWLLDDEPATIFTPEMLSNEHHLIAQTTDEFINNEVLPNLDKLEAHDWSLARTLVRRCGELGLLGANVPEQYGGLDLDKASSLIISERIARAASFGTTYGGQANLCIFPIALFGTDIQKQTYLPKLVAGEFIGAYALSESSSGSDAFAVKTRATRTSDDTWTLNGEKMWISNGGFADVIIVFAKVDGEHFTAFIVEKCFPGVSAGQEERKMGLHGSSTTPILLQDAKIPTENVLGEIGKGHKVALNALNYGRFKLGGMSVGGCRWAIGEAARYASEREQFGHPISDFGVIKHKLGEMTAKTYAMESLTYRTVGLIDDMLAKGTHDGAATASAFEEYAVEASITKVGGTEVLDFVLDENIQIHGANGFVKDYPAERYYRDSRVNRIFEGTNEINRILISGMLIRRALKGELALIPAAKRLQDELLSPSTPATLPSNDGGLEEARRAALAFKKVALVVLGRAVETYGQKLNDEQEILSYAADIVIDAYAAESAVLRARAATTAAHPHADLHDAAARTFVNDAAQRVNATARNALASMLDGDPLRVLLEASRRLLEKVPVNTVALRRRLADASVARGRYILES